MRNFIILFSIFFSFCASAQNVEYGVKLDTNSMLIGDQQNLSFHIKSEIPLNVKFPLFKDTLKSGVEIISGPLLDSIVNDGIYKYSSTYTITSFDTGYYLLPAYEIELKSEEYNSTLRTDKVGFVVNTFEVDLEKDNYDIVMPYEAPLTFKEILPYILYTLLGIVIIVLLVYLLRKIKLKKSETQEVKNQIPPFILAINELQVLKESKKWVAGQEKQYYTELVDIFRKYLDGEFDISAMETTTNEIMFALKNIELISAKEKEQIQQMFSTADFVKFAKFTPMQDDNISYLDLSFKLISSINERLEEIKKIQDAKNSQEADINTEKPLDNDVKLNN